jgi:hypothetical protein
VGLQEVMTSESITRDTVGGSECAGLVHNYVLSLCPISEAPALISIVYCG